MQIVVLGTESHNEGQLEQMLDRGIVSRRSPGELQLLLLLLPLGQLGLELGNLGHLSGIGNGIIRLGKAEEMILIVQLEGIVGLGWRAGGSDGMEYVGLGWNVSV